MSIPHRLKSPGKVSFRTSKPLSETRVAVVHEWLYTFAGAEKVLEQILALFPQAEIYSLIDFLPPSQRDFLGGRRVHTSFLQKMPLVRKKHQYYLPLMPLAMERFDLSSFDLIVSSSYAVAKGIISGPNQLHLCYCHSPVRYAWDLQHQYLQQWHMDRGARGLAATGILHKLRIWDHVTSNGVDRFLSNSQFIARRIWKTYRRRATVVYPPVDTDKFTPPDNSPREGYVTLSRLVGYKRIDLLVKAFQHLPGERLTVLGNGEEMERLRAIAPPNVRLLGRLPDDQVLRELRSAKAFLFAAEEDFGISPVEAQACGTPVLAYGMGGSLETVRGTWTGEIPHRDSTGVFFPTQSVDSVLDAIHFFESRKDDFQAESCVANARRFSPSNFRRRFLDITDETWRTFQTAQRDPNSTEWEY